MYPAQKHLLLGMYNNSLLLIDKPYGWTSFEVVKKVRKLFTLAKVGHTGTLDPMATGLLLLCTGKRTKEAAYYQALEKVYKGEITLGHTTPSFDKETPFDRAYPYDHITAEEVRKAATAFVGDIWQTPPLYSAIHLQGERAYKKARRNEKVTLPARQVSVRSLRIEEVKLPTIRFVVTCGKGFYVRSMAYDLSKRLGSGGYLSELRRTQVGDYCVEDAHTIEQLTQLKEAKKA